MSQRFEDLPEEIQQGVLAFLDVERQEVLDMRGLVQFVVEHGETYPSLLGLLKVDEGELTRHIQETGNVPPGVKAIRTRTVPGSNVTKLDIFHGPATVPKDED